MNSRSTARPPARRHDAATPPASSSPNVRANAHTRRASSPEGHGVLLTQLAMVVGSVLSANAAHANPDGGKVVGGSATIVGNGQGTLDIHQSTNKAIIDWQTFGIAAGETVNFLQPSASSVTLNRVLGNDPSAIFGRLNANGSVMLVNPNGIVFGPTARVDVGGLVATTANIQNDDFLAGRYEFGQASTRPDAGIDNQGHISIRDSGLAALVAPHVRNSGVIEAKLGRVALGGARTFTLDFQGDGLLAFGAGSALDGLPLDASGQPVGALVLNTGEIRADGGTVLLSAAAVKGVVDQVINTQGVISATSVGTQGGRIVLSGGDAGRVVVGGRLDASGRDAGTHGGSVVVTGERIHVEAGADVDASGAAGGGRIAIGSTGEAATAGAAAYADKSRSVDIDAGATLQADALAQGAGGHVTVWSQDATRMAGDVSARGGAQGGDGGFAEVSSEKDIALTGGIDLRAPHGRTGDLLVDPASLEISDSASVTNTGDVVSRGWLQAQSGNATITLQATGQITVDAMAGGLVALATTAGNTFTLASTQSGGIRFVDANTEIRTQGGNVALLAQGLGGSLQNVGKLTTQGGAVTLQATGDIQLASAVNAGSGAVSVQSMTGSIANGATAATVSGGSVTLRAAAGNVGASGGAIATHTGQLTLETGGNLVVTDDTSLTSLALTSAHVQSNASDLYQVSAPGLAFDVVDGAQVAVNTLSQPGGLNLSVASDRSVVLGQVNVGTGTLAVTATSGDLVGGSGNALTASSVSLSAQGSTGNNGAIGAAGHAVNTATGSLNVTAGTGGAVVANTGALALGLTSGGTSQVSTSGDLTLGAVTDTGALTLTSTGGAILDDGLAATLARASTLTLGSANSIGTPSTPLNYVASVFNASATTGDVRAGTTSGVAFGNVTAGNGAIALTTGGTTSATSLVSGTSSVANTIAVAVQGSGSLTVGTVNAGTQGNVDLSTTSGGITSSGTNTITGNLVTVATSATTADSINVRTAASHLNVTSGLGTVAVSQTGAVTIDQLTTGGYNASLTSSAGDVTVGTVATNAASGSTQITANGGAILDDGNAATRITSGSVSLTAVGSIGSAGAHLATTTTGLTLGVTGDLYLDNTAATLTSLSLTHHHATPGTPATLQLTSPYLNFDVTDDGAHYAVNSIAGVPLNTLSFSGDETLAVGQVLATGSVALTATQGSVLDDGNRQTRITGNSVTVSSAQNLGASTAPLSVNTASLSLTSHGDLFATDITDLASLAVQSLHADPSASVGLGITAPSFHLAATDAPSGETLQTLTDTTGLALSWRTDRNLTLGAIDVTSSGSAQLTSTAGSVLDDGDKSTRVLANSVALSATQALGATGTDNLDVETTSLSATASGGGVYVGLPMPLGSGNTTNVTTLSSINAAGPVQITAAQGGLSIGSTLLSNNNPVALTVANGSITGNGTINVGSGALTLNASGAIGSATHAQTISDTAGASITATAGTTMALAATGATTLSSLNAATGITYTQTSGATTVGGVALSGSGAVSLTNNGGALLDDGNTATGITASQVSLKAAGALGSVAAPLTLTTPSATLAATGDIGVTDTLALTTLNIDRTGAGAAGNFAITAGNGQVFSIGGDATVDYLQAITGAAPISFGFTSARAIKVGAIDVGTGSVTLATTASGGIVNDGVAGTDIRAGTVSLTAGSTGSIGAAGHAISLAGTSQLSASAGRDIRVDTDTALTEFTLASTNTSPTIVSTIAVTAPGQTFGITDSGATQGLNFGGTALTDFSFANSKNILVGAIAASGNVALSTAGGGVNANIGSDGSGRIVAGSVNLTATSTTAGGGAIGTAAQKVLVGTSSLTAASSGNLLVADNQALSTLGLTITHGTAAAFSYDVDATNIDHFAITDGTTQSLGNISVDSGALAFTYSADRALGVGSIDVGSSSTGSATLVSRSAPTGTAASIDGLSGGNHVTGGTVSLTAIATNGSVGETAALNTSTQNLAISAGGNVGVVNDTTLQSLTLDAEHKKSPSGNNTYAVSSTGLTLSVSDNTSTPGLQLVNIAQSGLNLTVKTDKLLTATSVNVGAGAATLTTTSNLQGSGANAVTAGALTVNASSVTGPSGSGAFQTNVTSLAGTVTGSLNLTNSGSLALNGLTVGSAASVTSTNGSLTQSGTARLVAPTLSLQATQGSVGATGTPLLVDTRQLTVNAGHDVTVTDASDLFALNLVSNHSTPGQQNHVAILAPGLALGLTDNVAGNQYHLANLVDASGLNFTLQTDVALSVGTVDAKAGHSITLQSTGTATSITNDGANQLTADNVTLSASGSIGTAGDATTRMQTSATTLAMTTGANAYVDDSQDLSTLSLTSTHATGGAAPVYQVTANALAFDITDDGTTHVNSVVDTTGLNFTLNTQRAQAIGVIDTTASGTVALTSQNAILGDADPAHRIVGGSVSVATGAGSGAGSVPNPLHLSAPLVTLNVTGAMNVESDTHIDKLTIGVTHPTGTYGGAYSILSASLGGTQSALLAGTDDATGTALTTLADTQGLAFSFTDDHAVKLGSLNLGVLGTVNVTDSAGILGDGDATTQARAASMTLYSSGGFVGTTGAGNGIDATVNSATATANNGVALALHGATSLSSIYTAGDVDIANDTGDIALGGINANDHAVTVNNTGGSILSGSLSNATTVSLTAAGSIGNTSAITTTAYGGGTTTLTATASAAHGAAGSVAVSETYGLAASSVTAAAGVTLSGGSSSGNLTVGIVNAGGAVQLSSSRGSVLGSSGANLVTGTGVAVNAAYGTGATIGSAGTALNVNTPDLTLTSAGSFYVNDTADLAHLGIVRQNTQTSGVTGGTLSLGASHLTFNVADSGTLSTLTQVADTTGLNFSYASLDALAIGHLATGSAGSVTLSATSISPAMGNITAVNGSSSISAGTVTLQASGSASGIGTSATPLGLATNQLTASAGSSGIFLTQAGNINLSNVATTGALSVTSTGGDITLGTLAYGGGQSLTVSATGGSLFSGGATLNGSFSGGTYGAINLSAADGIGTGQAPILVSTLGSGTAGNAVSATVTGSGSLYLNSVGALTGGLTTSTHDGATVVRAGGNINLASMSSATDHAGNDIDVIAAAGNITVQGSIAAGQSLGRIDLSANAGQVLASSGSSAIGAFEVDLFGANGVGSSTQRLGASGQRVEVSSNGGAIWLQSGAASIFSSVRSAGGAIDIATTGDLLLANVASGGGAITVAASGAGSDLIAGNVNAGAGAITLTSTGGAVLDDGNVLTRIAGGNVAVTAANGVGTDAVALQTAATQLTLHSGSGAGAAIHVVDSDGAGVHVASAVADNGAIRLQTAGDTALDSVVSSTNAAGNDIGVTSTGTLTIGTVDAGTHGNVALASGGAIVAANGSAHVNAAALTLSAVTGIGSVSNAATGAGTPLQVNVGSLASLTSSGAGSAVSLDDTDTAPLTLGGGLSIGPGGSLYLRAAGSLDASAGVAIPQGANLLLQAGGTLTLPSAGVSGTGAVTLAGATDVVAAGAAPRTLTVTGGSVSLHSGGAGGDTTLDTTTGIVDVNLGAHALVLDNTGTLTAATLSTTNGDITVDSSTGLAATSIVAGGAGRTIGLTADAGNLTTGTVDAGSAGTVTLSATGGALVTGPGSITASTLGLVSGAGIGSAGAGFATSAHTVSAQVTGTGDIFLAPVAAVTLGQITTHDGDIHVTAAGDILSGTGLSAGNSGNIALTSTGGNVTVTHTIVDLGSDATRSGVAITGQQIGVAGVHTGGAQHYVGATTLNGDLQGASLQVDGALTLVGDRVLDTQAANGAVHLAGSVDGGHALTIQAGSGDVTLSGAIGATQRLGALTIASSGQTRFDSSVRAASVTTDAAGTAALNGGTVDTTGAQTYGGHAVLGADTTLTGSTVSLAGADATTSGAQALTIAGNAVLSGDFGGHQALGGLTVDGATTFGGGATFTTGAQHYNGAAVLTGDQALSSQNATIAIAGTLDGGHALTISSGSADVAFTNAIGATQRLGALTIASLGQTRFDSSVRAASVSTDAAGSAVLNGATIDTTGNQAYAGTTTLANDQTLTSRSGTVAFTGTLDGAQALTVQAGAGASFAAVGATDRLGALAVSGPGTTVFNGAVRAASLSTGAATVNGGSVDTTGTQAYTGHVVLGQDTTLTASHVTIAQGADAVAATSQPQSVGHLSLPSQPAALAIVGDADLSGAIGAQQALSSLTVGGATTLGAGSIATTGAQHYAGAVTLAGDQSLTSTTGDLAFGSTLDSAGHASLLLGADFGSIEFGGAVGGSATPGALTVRAGSTVSFDGTVRAGSLAQTAGGGLTRFRDTLVVDGADGLHLAGNGFQFDAAVTATTGGVAIANAGAGASVTFAGNANVQAATGFVQTGAASVQLPATIRVTAGGISIDAPATLPAGSASLIADGDILLGGLGGASTHVTLDPGSGGRLVVGLPDTDAAYKIDVASLAVPQAVSAKLYGQLGGQGGATAATRVDSALVKAPYFINDTPWGPVIAAVDAPRPNDLIARVVAATTPVMIVPSTPRADALFRRTITPASLAPDALAAFASPKVLTIVEPDRPDDRKSGPRARGE